MGCPQDPLGKIGRLTFPLAMFAYPFYLWKRSPGKTGSHYDPACDLFVPQEASLVRFSPHLHVSAQPSIILVCAHVSGQCWKLLGK